MKKYLFLVMVLVILFVLPGCAFDRGFGVDVNLGTSGFTVNVNLATPAEGPALE